MKSEHGRRRLKRIALALGMAALVAGLALATRPQAPGEEPAERRTAADLRPTPMTPASPAAPPPQQPVPAGRKVAPPKPVPAGPQADRQAEHGPEAVVRTRDRLETAEQPPLELRQPVWDDPARLTFMLLKINYFYFKRHGAFSPGSLPPHHGGAVTMAGAVMPIDPPGPRGELSRFWLCNPSVVMAGCVFCNPPTLADLVYVEVPSGSFMVDREQLYQSVVLLSVTGRFFLGPGRTGDGIEYLYRIEFRSAEE